MGISTIKTVVVTTALAEPLAGKANIADLGTAAAEDVEYFATAAQGAKADSAVQPGSLGALATKSTVATADINASAVTNAKMADMAHATIKGRASGAGTGAPVDLTAAQVRDVLNVEDGATADMTGAEIKVAYEAEADTNAFTDADKEALDNAAIVDASIIDFVATDIRHDLVLSDEFIWAAGGNAVTPEGYLRPRIEAVDDENIVYNEAKTPVVFMLNGGLNASFGLPVLSDRFASVMASDQSGNVNLGFTPDGHVVCRSGEPGLSEWSGSLTDNGMFIVRYRADGRVALGPVPNVDWRVEMRGADDDSRHVYIYGPGRAEIQITNTAGPYRGAKIEGLILSYLDMTSGVGVETEVQLYAQTMLSSGITDLVHLIGTGQSLSNGQSSTPVLTTTAFDAGRAVMFTAGVKATGTAQSSGFISEVISAADVATFVNAYETGTETPMSETALQWLDGEASSTGALISTHGIGGAQYSLIKKGTIPYENMFIAMRRAYLLCSLLGVNYTCPYLLTVHGEANVTASKATYLGYLNEWRSDFTDDRNALTGETSEVMLVVDQISNWTAYSYATSEVPLAQLQVALDDPTNNICYTSKMMLPTADGIHLTNLSSINLGARRGRALAQVRAGTYTGALYMTSAVRTGASVVLTFNMPYGGDDIDLYTGLVSDPGNYGVEWSDAGDGNAVTISSVAATASNQVTVTLSTTPTGTAQKIGIAITGTPTANAGPTTGARNCIRSATADVDSHGTAMDHYALHQIIDVTV